MFDAIARSAAELCDASNSGVFQLRDGLVHFVGSHNVTPEQLALAPLTFPVAPHRGFMAGRAILSRDVAHVPDIAIDPEYTAQAMVRSGFRSALSVPMLRHGEPIGAINVTREEPRPFSERQIELVKTFADQAVIAIENARLFREVQARTRDLEEALAKQTSTAEILRVISQSPTDARPVFESIVVAAARILRCDIAFVMLVEGESWRNAAVATPEGLGKVALTETFPVDPNLNFPSRAIVARAMVSLPDWSARSRCRIISGACRISTEFKRRCICLSCAKANASAC